MRSIGVEAATIGEAMERAVRVAACDGGRLVVTPDSRAGEASRAVASRETDVPAARDGGRGNGSAL